MLKPPPSRRRQGDVPPSRLPAACGQQRSPHAAPVGRELEERGDAHLRQRGAQVSRESGVVLKQA
jgi:hypothetical protein